MPDANELIESIRQTAELLKPEFDGPEYTVYCHASDVDRITALVATLRRVPEEAEVFASVLVPEGQLWMVNNWDVLRQLDDGLRDSPLYNWRMP